jgi:hypothetical protein
VTDPAKLMAEDIVDEVDVVEQLLAATNDPAQFVRLAFPEIRLEAWQRDVLETIGETLRENARAQPLASGANCSRERQRCRKDRAAELADPMVPGHL